MRRRGVKAVAFAAAAALALTACGGDDPDPTTDPTDGTTDPGPTDPGEEIVITYAAEQEFASYNNSTADQNAFRNTLVLNGVQGSFWRFAPSGFAEPDLDFGTYELVSDDPQVVEYSINPDAIWSDGEPIDCADMLLQWAANSGTYMTGEQDEDGNDIPLFSTAGTTGFSDWEKPDCADGDKTLTVTYANVYATWEAIGAVGMPAHIVAEQGGLTKAELADAIRNDDVDAMRDAAEFYNSGWVMNPGQLLDESLIPSSDRYKLDEWVAGEFLSLVRNESYWGTPGNADRIVFRFLEQDQQAQALDNREVDIIDPQPNPDLVNQLQGMQGVVVETGESFTYEHMDFNMRPGGLFQDNLELREAFALCVPRQRIIDNLIAPQNPNAQVLNARLTYSFQPDYDFQVAGGRGEAWEQDIEASAAMLAELGAEGTEVRIGYQTPNPRRSNVVSLVVDACGEAGFEIVDAGVDDFFGRALAEGDWDIAMFAWVGSGYVSGTASTFSTPEQCATGFTGNNFGCYSNADVDALYAELLAELDGDAARQLVKQIEDILWEELPTFPLFTFPALAAWADDVEGVVDNKTQGGITWNMYDWNRAF
jgi:peptide/nickel transport system substrate-binding protein